MQAIKKSLAISILVVMMSSYASALEPVTLQLKWLHQFQFAGYYAAIEQGYYKEAGLDVQLREPKAGQDPRMAVIEGKADYGISTTDIVRLRADGYPVVALAVIFQHSPHALLAIRQSGIRSIHDLAGKKVMLQEGSADLLALLEEEKVPIDTIEFVDYSYNHENIIDGEVQAYSVYTTNEPISINKAGFEPLIFSPQTVGIDFYGDALFTTEAQIRTHPAQTEAFLKASLRGWYYAIEHPEEIVDLILAKYSQRKSKEELMFEAQKSISLIRADLIELGHMNPKRWEHIAKVLEKQNMLAGPLDIQSMLYNPQQKPTIMPMLQVSGIALLCIGLLGSFTYHQVKLKRQLQNEIERRKQGDQVLIQREKEYRNLYKDAPLAFIVWDTNLRIREWNSAAEALFGWNAKEVIDQSANDFLVPTSEQEKIVAGKASLETKSHHVQINQNLTKDGRTIYCKWHNVARRNSDGDCVEYHSIAIDASEEIAEQLRLKNEYSQAVDASEAKDQLLARTSHEIRNPLNAIMGFTQLIYSDSQDTETREMARIILDGAEGMLAILNDLLDSAKLDAGKMELNLSPVDLVKCVQKEARLFSQLISEQGLTFEVTIENNIPKIETDERLIGQILSNLINNARKFTANGKIEIQVTSEAQKHVIIQVQDTGIGMDEETLKHVFEPFVQGPAATKQKFGGTGLGLSLTQKLAHFLGGELTASSSLGEGSIFTLKLPSGIRAKRSASITS
jgi:PAS domain S-box-containing protein